MADELVVIEKTNVLTVFTNEDKIDPLLEEITSQVKGIVFDMETAKGRKECASAAYKVAQCKTYLDGLGKDLVAEMKEMPKKVDANRKKIRDYLDALKDEVRAPLAAWEAEQERIAEELAAKKAAEELAAKIESDHEIALLMNREFDRQAAEAARIAEEARIERDRQIAEQAAAKAKAAAEAAALAEKEASERREREAKLAQERAELEAAEQKRRAEQAEIDAKNAAEAAKLAAEKAAMQAEIDRKAAAEAAAKRERDRIEAEQREAAEADARRATDVEHKKSINLAAVAAIVKQCNMAEDQAKDVIRAIAKGLIDNVSIKY